MPTPPDAPRISLIITTYNRPDALAAVFRAVARQTLAPWEVVVGDDGSGPETAEVVRSAPLRSVPVRHVWNEHDGFRVARARNAAIAATRGDYLVFIDGDILPHPNFIEDHAEAAEAGHFVQGSRAILDERATRVAIEREAYWPSWYSRGAGNRKNLIRSRLLARLTRNMGVLVRASNFALWRSDAVRVNGFNEAFVGWGYEDNEFALRLENAGCRKKHLRFLALCCHLHHPPSPRVTHEENRDLMRKTVDDKLTWCEHGLADHLGSAPPASL